MNTTWQQAALFRPVTRQPLAAQIADQLREHIVLGALHEHDRLPPLRQLAKLFGVSTSTMREAIQVLSYLGVVKVNHGIGIFVMKGPESHRATVAGMRRASNAELVEMRGLLEVKAAKLMATAVRSGALEETLSDLDMWTWQRSDRRSTWPDEFLQADLEFHAAILAGAGSAYAASLHRQVCQQIRPSLLAEARRQSVDISLAKLHRSLAEAIDRGVVDRAGRLAEQIVAAEARRQPRGR